MSMYFFGLESVMKLVKETLKKLVFRYTKFGKPNYPYNVEPIQLSTIIMEIERLKDLDGCICEIGVARGMTTRFIAEHIRNQNIENKNMYFALDTFNSFVISDLIYEIDKRGKSLRDLRGFEYNSFEKWKKNFSKFNFVNAIQVDCSDFDYQSIFPIKVCFLDVDLYLPTKRSLVKIYDATIKGGVIIVDDVIDNATYDGAYQAYIEFCDEHNLEVNIIGNKCGLIYKQ